MSADWSMSLLPVFSASVWVIQPMYTESILVGITSEGVALYVATVLFIIFAGSLVIMVIRGIAEDREAQRENAKSAREVREAELALEEAIRNSKPRRRS